MEKKRSWACTFVLQVSLFIAFYLLSTWISLKRPFIIAEKALEHLLMFTFLVLEEDIDPLNNEPFFSNRSISLLFFVER
jgi:hypothetical protein